MKVMLAVRCRASCSDKVCVSLKPLVAGFGGTKGDFASADAAEER